MTTTSQLDYNSRPRQWTDRRLGVLLVAALICLLVVMLMAGVVVRALTLRQRALRSDERQLQCLYLLESAVSRAVARCEAEPSYVGETWTVTLDDHGNTLSGVVNIRVEPVRDEPLRRRLQLEARWPDDPVQRVQRHHDVIVTLSTSGAGT